MDVTTIIGNIANLGPGSDTLESQSGKKDKIRPFFKRPITQYLLGSLNVLRVLAWSMVNGKPNQTIRFDFFSPKGILQSSEGLKHRLYSRVHGIFMLKGI